MKKSSPRRASGRSAAPTRLVFTGSWDRPDRGGATGATQRVEVELPRRLRESVFLSENFLFDRAGHQCLLQCECARVKYGEQAGWAS